MSVLIVDVDKPTELILVHYADAAKMLTERGVPHLVNVDLNKDGVKMGRVLFSLDSRVRNERATRWTGLLTGSYVAVNGLAAFDVDDETGYDLMFDRLREIPRPDNPRTLRKARGESGL